MGWVNNKVLLYSTENYSQYAVISHHGKESKKRMCVYVFVCVCVCITESLCHTAEINTIL